MTYEEMKLHLKDDVEKSGFEIVYPVWEKLFDEDEMKGAFCAFYDGFIKRPSVRESNPSKTISDPLVDVLLKAKVSRLSDLDIELIRYGHRASMAVENIVGLILEEYIHDSLLPYGWSCCWGNCIKAVDLCSAAGDLIQIKNKSNTENSSSKKIREGTEIKKWYRLSAKSGKTNWDELNHMTKTSTTLSEDGFREFASHLVLKNPSIVYIDESEFAKIPRVL